MGVQDIFFVFFFLQSGREQLHVCGPGRVACPEASPPSVQTEPPPTFTTATTGVAQCLWKRTGCSRTSLEQQEEEENLCLQCFEERRS